MVNFTSIRKNAFQLQNNHSGNAHIMTSVFSSLSHEEFHYHSEC